MRWLAPLPSSLLLLLTVVAGEARETPIFPGPWERYIQAPESRQVRPRKVYYTEGTVSTVTGSSDLTVLKGQGALVTFEFAQNIAGRLFFEIDSATTTKHQSIGIAFSESPRFIGRRTDGTGDRVEYDLTQFQPLTHGLNSLDKDHSRGAFKYATLFIPHPTDPKAGQALPYIASLNTKSIAADLSDLRQLKFATQGGGQQPLLPDESIGIKDLWVNYSAFPSHENARRYTGYFYSNDNLLNRIWYAGAYTLQITTIPPKEGGTLVDLNKAVDDNKAPHGTWYSNFTISNGTSVTTDGAKRDRMVYAGDMTLAAPGIAVSTYDLVSIKNALDTLFEHYYHSSDDEDGEDSGKIRLPYAGPPMGFHFEFSDTYHMHALLGVYQYILYSGDLDYLKHLWWKYVQALEYSTSKIGDNGLMQVTSGNDWLRPGMGHENIEAQGVLLRTLLGSVKLAEWLSEDSYVFKDIKGRDLKHLIIKWEGYIAGLKKGIMAPKKLWNAKVGLFCDNPGDRQDIFPQDGNSWAVATGLVTGSVARRISEELRKRWGTYGAPAVELPNTISPFASGFELQAHTKIGNHKYALDLMRRQWGYMLDGPGFTNSTFIEGFRVDGDIQYPAYWSSTRNSHAHGWSAGPTSVLTDSILGIKLLSPRGKTWSISPNPGDLTHVEGGFQTSLGKFTVNYDKTANEEVLEVETPEESMGILSWGGLVGGLSMETGGKWRLTKGKDGKVRGGRVKLQFVDQKGPGQERPENTEEL